MWHELRSRIHHLRQDNEAVIDEYQHERDGDAGAGFAAMRADAEWNSNERKTDAGE
ncbi:hypothetical protein D3C83_235800 [compost metagenome]